MASLIKRKKSYSIVYNYTDENGETKQKWESVRGYQEALKRKAEVENEISKGTFVAPSSQTIKEFLDDFISMYGQKKWGVRTYEMNCAYINNYVIPIIGDMKIQDMTTRAVDKYIQTLQKTPKTTTWTRPNTEGYVTDKTIVKITKLLRCAFNQAVRWEIIGKNPFDSALIPKITYNKRSIWDADIIKKALDNCEDSKLYIAMNLSFACSLRIGEILGLTWDNVFISDDDIASDNAHICIEKELSRVSKNALTALEERDVIYTFQPLYPNTSTRLVLKKPKTESSIRQVWLPKTLAFILRDVKKDQEELKSFLGDEYQDFNLVVAQQNGRPCEEHNITKEFSRLKKKADLPDVVFHSLRHSSTTYKLKLNHGDLKATQGDTGHAQISMITDVYAHILDEDRKINAQKFEAAFYAKKDYRETKAPQDEPNVSVDLNLIIEALKNNPELASTLANLITSRPST